VLTSVLTTPFATPRTSQAAAKTQSVGARPATTIAAARITATTTARSARVSDGLSRPASSEPTTIPAPRRAPRIPNIAMLAPSVPRTRKTSTTFVTSPATTKTHRPAINGQSSASERIEYRRPEPALPPPTSPAASRRRFARIAIPAAPRTTNVAASRSRGAE